MSKSLADPHDQDPSLRAPDLVVETEAMVQEIVVIKGMDPVSVMHTAVSLYREHINIEANGWAGPLYIQPVAKGKGAKKFLNALSGAIGLGAEPEEIMLVVDPIEKEEL